MPKPASEHDFLEQCFDDLFPMFRSITGPGIEQSIEYLTQFMPLVLEKVPSGSKVFDWTTPREWHCQRARLWGPNGALICDTDINNLQVVNYSTPIDRDVSLEELKQHLHHLPDLPTAIPYVTSYYKENWGFCISNDVYESLSNGTYRVLIEAKFIDGGVPFASCVLPGESEKEVLLSSYLCHPSLANNELSGPLALLSLYRRLSSWKKRRYTYRFLVNPETIGSLCFIHRYQDHLNKFLVGGLILTCVGGPAERLRYKASRRGDTIMDELMFALSEGKEGCGISLEYQNFDPTSGSDERQYCAPGFNYPMGQISRTVYGEYDGYHNSLDDKQFMGIDSLLNSVDAIERVLTVFEISGYPVNQSPFGEPQLGKRNLYPSMNSQSTRDKSDDMTIDSRTKLNRILTLLNMGDGLNRMRVVADACHCSVEELRYTVEELEEQGLLKLEVRS
ncbi:DUF4910 domain-containing protein [Arenicella xantha]|uniref:Aminopeptidase-like protein n=1 Tax=Arenicella xantha TaxID=644221 RepID=A0A395JJ61_9GAMM|nr:DUF4910 domain-containing protein [Arenicella xantha]RBP49893.1 aminopeptidase-like protein [Arenicella xantha]